MVEAVPTPYDIAALPYFPASPGLLEWSIFFLCAAALIGVAWIRNRAPRVDRVPPSVARQVLHDLNNVVIAIEAPSLHAPTIKRLLAELSVSVRRSLPAKDALRFETMSAQEIERHVAEGAELQHADLMRALLPLEAFKFIPDELILPERTGLIDAFTRFRQAAERYYGKGAGVRD